jgi:predicted GNAT family N-acyltransferase
MTGYETQRFDGETAFPDAYEVRRDVFIEEQDVDEAIEMDGNDDDATHFVIYDTDGDGDQPVATARVRYKDADTAKAERVAVLAEYRGEGLGRRLMELLEDEARATGHSQIDLHAQTAVEGFYRALGYETVSDEFVEAGIPHVEMEKEIGD